MSAPVSGEKVRVFIDSSVLVAAVLSSTGGSFRLCRESSFGRLHLITNRYVLQEVTEVLHRKYPNAVFRLHEILPWSRIKVYKNPPLKTVKSYLPFIRPKDAPILAGAVAAGAVFLLTLDHKDFFSQRLREVSSATTVTTPKEFFNRHWRF